MVLSQENAFLFFVDASVKPFEWFPAVWKRRPLIRHFASLSLRQQYIADFKDFSSSQRHISLKLGIDSVIAFSF